MMPSRPTVVSDAATEDPDEAMAGAALGLPKKAAAITPQRNSTFTPLPIVWAMPPSRTPSQLSA